MSDQKKIQEADQQSWPRQVDYQVGSARSSQPILPDESEPGEGPEGGPAQAASNVSSPDQA